MVGRLLYLGLTRPNLTHALQISSQFLSAYSVAHWHVVIHVLKYLKGSMDLGVFYPANSDLRFRGFSDANWAACIDTRYLKLDTMFSLDIFSFLEDK